MLNDKNTKKMNAKVAKEIFKTITISEQPKGEFILQAKVLDVDVVLFYNETDKTKEIIMYNKIWHCNKNLSELFSFNEIAQAIIYNHIF